MRKPWMKRDGSGTIARRQCPQIIVRRLVKVSRQRTQGRFAGSELPQVQHRQFLRRDGGFSPIEQLLNDRKAAFPAAKTPSAHLHFLTTAARLHSIVSTSISSSRGNVTAIP